MKIRPQIIGFIAVIAVLITLVLWLGKRKAVVAGPTPETNATHTSGESTAPQSAHAPSNAPVAQSSANTATPTRQLGTTEPQMREELAKLNDQEILLYGRVADQFNAPVEGAIVSGIIQVNNGTRVGTDRMSTRTDGNGHFTISGHRGENLGIHVEKIGYVMAATNTSFIFSFLWPESQRFSPDPNNPVVIKMWKLQGVEPLVGIKKEYKLPFTNAPMIFDLVSGEIVATGGDLKITINRPDGVISQQHPQNWNINIEVVGGGFIETSDEESSITYVAPGDGYQANGSFGNNNGPDLVEKTFFIRSRDGRVYSKVHLLFGINDTPGSFMDIIFNGMANTNGSPNWEATVPR